MELSCFSAGTVMNDPVGPLAEHIALDAKLPAGVRPLVYPTLDDQAGNPRAAAQLAAQLVEVAGERPGERPRPAARAGPADGVAEQVQPDPGDRAARAVQRRVAVQGRAEQQRGAVA